MTACCRDSVQKLQSGLSYLFQLAIVLKKIIHWQVFNFSLCNKWAVHYTTWLDDLEVQNVSDCFIVKWAVHYTTWLDDLEVQNVSDCFIVKSHVESTRNMLTVHECISAVHSYTAHCSCWFCNDSNTFTLQ